MLEQKYLKMIEKIKKLFSSLRKDDRKKCTCGENEYCTRVSKSNFRGDLWVETEDHFKCGKVQKQVRDGLDLVRRLGI
jgi:hypothetical protein